MNLFVLQHLSYLSYFDLPDKDVENVREFVQYYANKKENKRDVLLQDMKAAPYQQIQIIDYVNDNEDSGLVLYHFLWQHQHIVVFRGSESYRKKKSADGWQDWSDNVDTLFEKPTYQQQKALDYVDLLQDGPLILSGHSKGGNLAMYCACAMKHTDNVSLMVSFNAPNLPRSMIKRYQKQINTLNKRKAIVHIENEYDIVSSLFLPLTKPSYVKSQVEFQGLKDIGAVHLLDDLKDNGVSFVYVKQKQELARQVYCLFNEVIMRLPKEELQVLVKPLYLYYYADTSIEELCNSLMELIPHYEKLILHYLEHNVKKGVVHLERYSAKTLKELLN